MECSSTELGYRQNTSYRAKNVVNVLKLVTKDTIEEKIIHLQGKKAKLAEDIIEGKGDSRTLFNPRGNHRFVIRKRQIMEIYCKFAIK